MFQNRRKFIVLAALLAVGGIGLGIHHWATAAEEPDHLPVIPATKVEPRADKDAGKPQSGERRVARRREAIIQMPVGTFVKEVDAAPHGSGRLTWTYEEERVVGLIEGSILGVEFELATEAEYSLSSSGTVYGVLTNVQLNRLELPEGEMFDKLKPFAKLWPAAEPLVNEVTTDLPFSYRIRMRGDQLVISNFRMLLAGPNPLGKLGAIALGQESFVILGGFQALGTAIEGTYTVEGKQRHARSKRRSQPRSESQPSR